MAHGQNFRTTGPYIKFLRKRPFLLSSEILIFEVPMAILWNASNFPLFEATIGRLPKSFLCFIETPTAGVKVPFTFCGHFPQVGARFSYLWLSIWNPTSAWSGLISLRMETKIDTSKRVKVPLHPKNFRRGTSELSDPRREHEGRCRRVFRLWDSSHFWPPFIRFNMSVIRFNAATYRHHMAGMKVYYKRRVTLVTGDSPAQKKPMMLDYSGSEVTGSLIGRQPEANHMELGAWTNEHHFRIASRGRTR